MNTCLYLNDYLSYGPIPQNQRHQRAGTKNIEVRYWMKLTQIPNWDILNLRRMSVRTDYVRLVDPEICFTTNTERWCMYNYYTRRGRTVVIPQFIVRDNNSGHIYLPQDVSICS